MKTPTHNTWRIAAAVALALGASLSAQAHAEEAAPPAETRAAAPVTDTTAVPVLVAANEAPPPVPTGMSGREFFKQGDKKWEVGFAPFVHHWAHDPEYHRVGLVNLERHNTLDHSFWGVALFPNSFGQNSAYGYYGHEWNDAFNLQNFYVKVSAGVIYGYRGPYQGKLPVHAGNWAPVIIPGVGYRLTQHDAVQMAVLGTAGVIFMYSRSF